jgi:hypothetical protein
MAAHGVMRLAGVASLLISCGLAAAQSRETVFQIVSSEKLETILKDLGVAYQKEAGKKGNIFTYRFERQGKKIRLHNYGGEDLWIETDITDKATLDIANRWNMRAKFSRAVIVNTGERPAISLEGQIDCSLGITDGMVRQFIQRFDAEIEAFVSFSKK